MNMVRHSILGIAFAVTICGTTNADEITFQGLTGSSTRHDVLGRFPNARPERRDDCKPGETEEKVGPEGEELDCNELKVNGYDVAGIKFDISFTFGGPSRNLLFVNLLDWWAFPNDADTGKRLDKSQIVSRFEQLQTILISNHGMPYVDPIVSCYSKDDGRMLSLCARWEGKTGEFPDDSLGTIDLQADAQKASEEDLTYSGDFQISFQLKPQFKGL